MTQELRKLAEAATQGKWSQTPPSGIYQGRMIVTDDRAACIGETHHANATENAAFIAASNPAAIIALLDRVEKAEKDAARYQVLRDDKYQLHEDDISVSDMCFQTYFGTDLDEAVDALEARFSAMEASK